MTDYSMYRNSDGTINYSICTPLYRCSDGQLRNPSELKAAGVAMDAAASQVVSSESLAEQKERAALELAYGKGYRLDQLRAMAIIHPILERGEARSGAVANDVALNAEDLKLIRTAIAVGSKKPARRQAVARRAALVALDAYGQPASHAMAVNNPGELQSSESLNDLYTRLKAEGRDGYKYEF
jgi:site-specific recombinase XerC